MYSSSNREKEQLDDRVNPFVEKQKSRDRFSSGDLEKSKG